MLPDTEIVALTERLRRNFPRHADVQAVCDVADALVVAKNRAKPSMVVVLKERKPHAKGKRKDSE